jgi:hypothetical protein
LSSIVPVLGVLPAGQTEDAEDPLIFNSSRLIPASSGRFSKAEDHRMRFYFTVLAPLGSSVKARVEFLQNGQVLAEAPGELPTADAKGLIRFLSEFPLEPFSPGDFNLRVTVETSHLSAQQSCSFVIIP